MYYHVESYRLNGHTDRITQDNGQDDGHDDVTLAAGARPCLLSVPQGLRVPADAVPHLHRHF